VAFGANALSASTPSARTATARAIAPASTTPSDVEHGISNKVFAGRDTFSAYTVGGYWTHCAALGWYLDSVLKGTRYDMKGQSTTIPPAAATTWTWKAMARPGTAGSASR
jgi:hypothetical protein